MSDATQRLLEEAEELEKRAKQKRALAQKKLTLARKAEAEAERKALAELKHRLGGFVLSQSEKEGVGRRLASNLRQPFFDDLQKLQDVAQRERLLAVFEKHYKPAPIQPQSHDIRPS